MAETVWAIYENRVLRLLESAELGDALQAYRQALDTGQPIRMVLPPRFQTGRSTFADAHPNGTSLPQNPSRVQPTEPAGRRDRSLSDAGA